MPANTTNLIQQIDQSITDKIKWGFCRRLMQCVIDCNNAINEFYKIYNIYDVEQCIDMITESQKDVTIDNARNAWNKLIKSCTYEEEERAIDTIQDLMSTMSEHTVSRDHFYLKLSKFIEYQKYQVLENSRYNAESSADFSVWIRSSMNFS